MNKAIHEKFCYYHREILKANLILVPAYSPLVIVEPKLLTILGYVGSSPGAPKITLVSTGTSSW